MFVDTHIQQLFLGCIRDSLSDFYMLMEWQTAKEKEGGEEERNNEYIKKKAHV